MKELSDPEVQAILKRHQAHSENLPDINLALRRAAAAGAVTDVTFLLAHCDVDVNAASSNGLTAKAWAIKNGHVAVQTVIDAHIAAKNTAASSIHILTSLNIKPEQCINSEKAAITNMLMNLQGDCFKSSLEYHKMRMDLMRGLSASGMSLNQKEIERMQSATRLFFLQIISLMNTDQKSHLATLALAAEDDPKINTRIAFKILEQVIKQYELEVAKVAASVFSSVFENSSYDKEAHDALQVLKKTWTSLAIMVNEDLSSKFSTQNMVNLHDNNVHYRK